ncbi:MAG: hypothetical protein ACJ75P_09050 [Gaiellaceae bacterium]
MDERPVRSQETLLWAGAVATAAAALFFPKVEGVRNGDEPLWKLILFFVPSDVEGVILIPLVVLLVIGVFGLVGRWAWRDDGLRNRPARVGLVCGVLGFVGVLAFFVSAPIVLGGLGLTLAVEGRRQAPTEGRGGEAIAAIVVSAAAVLVGAGIWAFA